MEDPESPERPDRINDQLSDLGFGRAAQSPQLSRLVNPDGSLNAERHGISFFESLSLYHFLISRSWRTFLVLCCLVYLLVNIAFAMAFAALGPGAINGITGSSFGQLLPDCFFFSIQTFATIGYGVFSPNSLAAHLLVALESICSLLVFALITGIVFTRFARPQPRVKFSDVALVAPFQGKDSLQFRIANLRKGQLIEPQIRVVFTWLENGARITSRSYRRLELFIDHVIFFPYYWTLTHIVDSESPLHGVTHERLAAMQGEFLVLLTAFDETFGETVYIRHSYRYDEVIFHAKFVDMYVPGLKSGVAVDVRKLSGFEKLNP